MGLTITQVDAFTERPFAGNPAAVCLLEKPRDASWMQLVAREMNLSETAFLLRRDDSGEDFHLRWFTPTVEVDLCGHATLASAHALWEDGCLLPDATARFHTRSGVLTATKKDAWIEMDFPATPAAAIGRVPALESALGVKEPRFTGRPRFDYLIEVGAEEEVRALRPDFAALRHIQVRGVIVTSRAGPAASGYDFVSRFFAPGSGIDEDPATGSAHCCLGPYWKERLGRDNLVGYQASARGGFVRTHCSGDRVLLSGQAVTVLRAELL
jgi:PhzF family phenazine biosynthesis protein